jgi:hypothetical protein
MTQFSRFMLALVAILVLASPALAQRVYKWTDAQGVVHYADAPPEGVKFERVNVSSGTARTEAEPSPDSQGEGAAAAPVTSPQCLQARANLDTLSHNTVVRKDVDGDGTPEDITGDALQQEIIRAQKLVDAYCS